MRRKIAEAYMFSYICPLCQYLDKTEEGIIKHLIEKHEDKEAYWIDFKTGGNK